MKDNIGRLILSRLLTDRDRPAIGDDASVLTRGETLAAVREQATVFQDAGIGADSFVVVLGGRGIWYWIDVLALWVLGAKAICVEATIEDAHGASVLEMTDARFVCSDGVDLPPCFNGLTEIPKASVENGRGASVALADFPFANDEDLPDLAAIIFTSGTTGLPKGVPLSHRALMINALATCHTLNLRESDRLFTATPYRFISSISHFLVTLLSRGAYFGVEHKIMIKDLLDLLTRLEITAFGGSPFHLQFLAMAGKERLPHLRWAMSSGDHLRTTVIDKLSESFDDLELHVVYGMAELGGRFCALPPDHLENKKGSVGFPIAGLEVTVRDETGKPCPPGEIGDVFVRGHIDFEGYIGRDDENARVLTPHGFLNGDKGYLDDDGFLFLSGRSDSVFKRSGLKVSAQVIADALINLDTVSDAFVTGQDDMVEGTVPVAYIAWRDNPLSDADLLRALRETLAVNHLPKNIVSVPEVPRTGSGKVDRRRLREVLDGEGS